MKKHEWKRVLALALCGASLMTMVACGGNKTASTPQPEASSGQPNVSNVKPTEAATDQEVDYPDYVTGPVTIQIWHASGAGAAGDYMAAAVKAFNESNEYGITAEEQYIGSYAEVSAKASTAMAAQDAPHIIVIGSGNMPSMAADGVLADMAPYAARDNFDVDNFLAGTAGYCWYDGKLCSIPFARSAAVFYYNKTMWDELGLTAPTSIEDLAVKAKTIYEKKGIYGFGVHFDPNYFQDAIVRSLGADGVTASDGKGPGGLENGEMLKMLTDWRSWIDEGWCRVPAVTKAENDMKDALYSGRLASMLGSCGGLKNSLKQSAEAGFELGVSLMPVYGGYGSDGGGGNMCLIGKDHSQQEIAAAWEFIKFISSDEWVAKRAVETGYLPVTYSSTKTDIIQNLWAEEPAYKVGYDMLEYAKDPNWSMYQVEWATYLKQAMSYVIQDQTMTPEEGVEYLKEQGKIVFGS